MSEWLVEKLLGQIDELQAKNSELQAGYSYMGKLLGFETEEVLDTPTITAGILLMKNELTAVKRTVEVQNKVIEDFRKREQR